MADQHNGKDEFQLERIAFFSDAVFAIAITLLIIEIKVPEVHETETTDPALWEKLKQLLPKFVGFIISFFVIGLYWLAHHRMFKYVQKSSQKLLWNNLWFLLPIVIMPFSTAFFSEYYNHTLKIPLGIYAANICIAGLLSYRLWRVIGDVKNGLTVNMNPVIINYNSARALVIPGMFILAFLLSFLNPWMAYIIPLVVPVATKIINVYFKRKHPEVIERHLN